MKGFPPYSAIWGVGLPTIVGNPDDVARLTDQWKRDVLGWTFPGNPRN